MSNKKEITIQCVECGEEFTFSVEEQEFYKTRGFSAPKRCKICRKSKKERYELRKKKENDRKWREQEEQRIAELLAVLPYQKLNRVNLRVHDSAHILYIIGNGFDIMHGVSSRYSDFRDSLGRRNELRRLLETYLKTDSLWSDFEEALAHIDGGAMLSTVDMWMDIFDAYNPDAQAADYLLAIDTATAPAQQMMNELPRRFRRWVETLKPTSAPMWSDVFQKEGRYLNFNYTEFLETLYEIPSRQITYIHGCRKNKKQKLVLGHMPDVGDEDNWFSSLKLPKYKSRRKTGLFEGALDTAVRQIGWFDEEATKKTNEIIQNHRVFFDSLYEISEVIVIGHSLSKVDYPYFQEIVRCNQNRADWAISWYSSDDLENIQAFVNAMGIKDNQVTILK